MASAFSKAFSEARAAGKKTFEFKGKSYTTRLAGESREAFEKKFSEPKSKPKPKRGMYEGTTSDEIAAATARPTTTNSGQGRKAARTRADRKPVLASGEDMTPSPRRLRAVEKGGRVTQDLSPPEPGGKRPLTDAEKKKISKELGVQRAMDLMERQRRNKRRTIALGE